MTEIVKSIKFYQQPIFINLILLVFNSLFFVFKLFFGILANSLALQADAFDSMTDIVLCLTALIGFLFSKKKPNEKFPYGYYKMENIVSLIIALFVFLTAYYITIQSLLVIINYINGNPKTIDFSPVLFTFLIISFLTSVLLTLYLKLINNQARSPIIESEMNEKLFDVFISLSIIVGFIGIFFNFYILDSIIGLIIVIFLIKGGYDIFLSSTKTLLDAVIDFENRTELYNLVEVFPKVKKVEKLEVRSYGKYIFLELDISLNKNFPLSQIDLLKSKLKNKIKKEFPLIFKIVIIIHSQDNLITKIAIPLENNQGLNSKIAKHFGECPYFGFLESLDNNFIKFEIVINKYAKEVKRKGLLVSEWLISEKSDKVYLKEALNKGPSLILENSFVELELTDLDILKDVINKEKKSTQIQR